MNALEISKSLQSSFQQMSEVIDGLKLSIQKKQISGITDYCLKNSELQIQFETLLQIKPKTPTAQLDTKPRFAAILAQRADNPGGSASISSRPPSPELTLRNPDQFAESAPSTPGSLASRRQSVRHILYKQSPIPESALSPTIASAQQSLNSLVESRNADFSILNFSQTGDCVLPEALQPFYALYKRMLTYYVGGFPNHDDINYQLVQLWRSLPELETKHKNIIKFYAETTSLLCKDIFNEYFAALKKTAELILKLSKTGITFEEESTLATLPEVYAIMNKVAQEFIGTQQESLLAIQTNLKRQLREELNKLIDTPDFDTQVSFRSLIKAQPNFSTELKALKQAASSAGESLPLQTLCSMLDSPTPNNSEFLLRNYSMEYQEKRNENDFVNARGLVGCQFSTWAERVKTDVEENKNPYINLLSRAFEFYELYNQHEKSLQCFKGMDDLDGLIMIYSTARTASTIYTTFFKRLTDALECLSPDATTLRAWIKTSLLPTFENYQGLLAPSYIPPEARQLEVLLTEIHDLAKQATQQTQMIQTRPKY